MGIFKAAPAVDYAQQAATRRAAGRHVHTVIWQGTSALSLGSMDGLSDLVEAVEATGWRLDRTEHLAQDTTGRPTLLLLFRAA
ncbi:hypothetical protein [Streptomyces sp. NPDC096068]|uniref:hypothetical protein n=1 Tax=Streptomyces sp. NPDC096068 TaxID=3155424 RepID=UPI00332AED03